VWCVCFQCGSSGSGQNSDGQNQDEQAPQDDGGGAPPQSALSFCPAYVDSPIYRKRAVTLVVGPNDDWKGAISKATPDTEILLRDGVYPMGNTYAIYIPAEVTIRGQSGDKNKVLIQGAGYAVGNEGLTFTGANSTVADLSMTGQRHHAISIKGELGAQAPHIYNVSLYDVGTQHIKGTPGGVRKGVIACSSIGYNPGKAKGDYVDAIDIHEGIDWVVRDNFIYNLTGDGSGCEVDDCSIDDYVSGPAILFWNNSSGTIVERNTIANSFRNIAFGLGRGHTGGIIRNNFIYRIQAGDAGIEIQGARGVKVYNNTVRIFGYPGAIEVRQSQNIDVANNLVTQDIWDRGGNTGLLLRSNMTFAKDVEFLSPDSPYLSAISSAIGAGISLVDVPEDFEGQSRDGLMDIGADQSF